MRKAPQKLGSMLYHHHSFIPLTPQVGTALSGLHGTEGLCDGTELSFFAYQQEAGHEVPMTGETIATTSS